MNFPTEQWWCPRCGKANLPGPCWCSTCHAAVCADIRARQAIPAGCQRTFPEENPPPARPAASREECLQLLEQESFRELLAALRKWTRAHVRCRGLSRAPGGDPSPWQENAIRALEGD